ncbi:MAG: hypothetical protein HN356_07905 [Calditrichaeota bacterium]|jgi:hypothetical protein|nr:hypothetical protein [Calditrichota bacterium]MBT7617323.1 hypothetical protein [Calditrichota bacterium]MBT7787933.1 hypothetical protein [Calditrichota bacterium]
MLSKTDLLEAILQECDICIHLYGKIPEGGLEYRPSSEQRNTLELLRYISFCGLGFASAMIDGSWEGYSEIAGKAEMLEPDNFPAAMEEQKKRLSEVFNNLSDEDFADKEATLPWGNTVKLCRALLDISYRVLSGYRMQLFLYVKAAGNHDIGTPNCWAGADAQME